MDVAPHTNGHRIFKEGLDRKYTKPATPHISDASYSTGRQSPWIVGQAKSQVGSVSTKLARIIEAHDSHWILARQADASLPDHSPRGIVSALG